MTDSIATPSDAPRALPDFSRARRHQALALIRRSGILRQDAETQLVYAIGLLIADDHGYLAEQDLVTALCDHTIVQVARELLRKAAA